MMDSGWIKLHRKLKQKGYYTDSEYVHLWVHILMEANHDEKEFLFNNSILKLKRGQFVTGRKVLAKETGINEHKIDRILKCFESEQQIEQQMSSRNRIITIKNYDQHQTGAQLNAQQVSSKCATSAQQVSTNKELKNYKNERIKETRVAKNATHEDMQNSKKLMANLINTNESFRRRFDVDPKKLESQVETWAEDIEKLRRIDGMPGEQISAMIEWLFTSENANAIFWRANIQSGKKLREKFPKLIGAMEREAKEQVGNTVFIS